MTTLIEGARTAEAFSFLLPEYSTDQVTYAAGNNIVSCQVVKGPDTAVVPAVAADTTGMFLSYDAYNATAAAKRGTAVKRLATVNENLITYPVGATAPQKATIKAYLISIGLVVRA